MKWIKLFESFQSDALEDAKDILRLHLGEIEEIDILDGDLQVLMSDDLKDRIRVYRLLEYPNVRDLQACKAHLEEETEGVFWNVNLNWYSGRIAVVGIGDSIESFLAEWLRERFSGLIKYLQDNRTRLNDKRDQVFWREANGSAVFYYYENGAKTAHFSYQKI